jgi:hypothetical protein
MHVSTRFALVLLGTALFSAANAQDPRDDEADVLLTIEREWEASLKGDQDNVDKMLTSDFMGWGKDSPAPRSKTSTWKRLASSPLEDFDIEVESLCTANGASCALRDLPFGNHHRR